MTATVTHCVGCKIDFTLEDFRKLDPVPGEHIIRNNDGQEPTTSEWRNCACHSTLMLEFDRNGDLWSEPAPPPPKLINRVGARRLAATQAFADARDTGAPTALRDVLWGRVLFWDCVYATITKALAGAGR